MVTKCNLNNNNLNNNNITTTNRKKSSVVAVNFKKIKIEDKRYKGSNEIARFLLIQNAILYGYKL